jgi:proline iminopeptidase
MNDLSNPIAALGNDLRDLYPPIEPYHTGALHVSGGHRLVYEQCGNPAGRPVVFLHGGPGAGCTPIHRQFFDPRVYRIVLFDQRGAGRSTPYASIVENTTAHLVSDIESIRQHLNIRQWVVFGGSWGSTLALAYAAAHPEACRALVLRGIWHCRAIDLTWWFENIRMVYPDYWRAFAEHIPSQERGDLLDAYLRRLLDPNPAIHLPAAISWDTYETSCEKLLPAALTPNASIEGILAMPRLEAYYMRNSAFLRENELIDAVPRFRHVPAEIVHGRYDMLCPLEGAVTLAAAWPEARLSIVPDGGHSALERGIRQKLVAATDRFRED